MTVEVEGTFRTGLWIKIKKHEYTLMIREIKIPISYDELVEIRDKCDYELGGGIRTAISEIVQDILKDLKIEIDVTNIDKLLKGNIWKNIGEII